MSYVVLARKWRPQTFADLTGQQHVATTLTNAIERERVPHAMLFTGARGVGKTSTARILSMALNCAGGPTTTPCGTCDSCLEIQQGRSVDVLEIDGASNRGINEIRELRDGVRYAPNRDRHKIYIIDEVHMLTTEAFNALLKTLEEPPQHVVFLFATTEAHKIPVTILSRCQRFDFRRIPHAEIVGRLKHITSSESLEIDDEVLSLIARQAAGGMRDALSLMDQVIAFAGTTIGMEDAAGILGAAERRRLFELSAAVLARDVDAALRVLDAVVGFGVSLPHFAADIVAHLRDLVVVRVSRDPAGLTALTDSELVEARTQANSTDPATLHRMFEIMVVAAEEIARSNHASLVFEMAIVRMAALEPLHRIDAIIERLEAVARGTTLPTGSDEGSDGGPNGNRSGDSGFGPAGVSDASAVESARATDDAATTSSVQHAMDDRTAEREVNEPSPVAFNSAASTLVKASEAPAPEAPLPDSEVAAAVTDRPVDKPSVERINPTLPASEAPAESHAVGAETPIKEAPVDAEPVDAEPVDAEPVDAEPVDAEPVDAEPVDAEPVDAVPGDAAAAGCPIVDGALWRAAVRDVRDASERTSALLIGATLVEALPGAIRVAVADALLERWVADDTMQLITALEAHVGGRIRVEVVAEGEVDDTTLESGYQVHREMIREREAHVKRVRDFVLSHRVIESVRTHWPDARVTEIHVPELPEETRP